MLDTNVSYSFYVDAYGGTLSKDEFDGSCSAAVAHVRYLAGDNLNRGQTMPRGGYTSCPGDEPDSAQIAVYMAICAVADVFATVGTSNIGGFTIGSFSMTNSGEGINPKELATGAAREYLAPYGLMFCGVI